ncbi:MAG: glycosyltransferase [Planctomycetota bacterium]
MSERTFFSVVAPAHNEEDNVRPLVERVGAAARAVCEQWPEVDADAFEMIVVDDGSTDQTLPASRRCSGSARGCGSSP